MKKEKEGEGLEDPLDGKLGCRLRSQTGVSSWKRRQEPGEDYFTPRRTQKAKIVDAVASYNLRKKWAMNFTLYPESEHPQTQNRGG